MHTGGLLTGASRSKTADVTDWTHFRLKRRRGCWRGAARISGRRIGTKAGSGAEWRSSVVNVWFCWG